MWLIQGLFDPSPERDPWAVSPHLGKGRPEGGQQGGTAGRRCGLWPWEGFHLLGVGVGVGGGSAPWRIPHRRTHRSPHQTPVLDAALLVQDLSQE